MRTRSDKIVSQPTCILTADWHIRPTVPVCRTDDFITAMWKKVDFILDLAIKHQVPILIAGDMGLRSQWPSWLEEEFISKVKEFKFPGVYAIPGQHDLPDHNLELWRKSSIGVLHAAGAVTFFGVHNDYWPNAIQAITPFVKSIFSFPFGIEIAPVARLLLPGPIVAIAHTLVTEENPEEFLKGARSAISILNDFPEFDLILTGDNHKPFVVYGMPVVGNSERNRSVLVNPGSLMRTSADQVDHKPRVYLWYAQDNHIEPVYLPIEDGVVDRTHIDIQEEKDQRIESYVNRLKEEVEIGLDFEANLETYFRNNRIRHGVKDRVWQALGRSVEVR